MITTRSSPRPWGCFHCGCSYQGFWQVFPTPVGVFPILIPRKLERLRLPHARGGVSVLEIVKILSCVSSPRPWGCFYYGIEGAGHAVVFPTPVGVFPAGTSPRWGDRGLPHARGGVSRVRENMRVGVRSSPRPWGCFHGIIQTPPCYCVFPTPVGVFLLAIVVEQRSARLPHARGGVSSTKRWRMAR